MCRVPPEQVYQSSEANSVPGNEQARDRAGRFLPSGGVLGHTYLPRMRYQPASRASGSNEIPPCRWNNLVSLVGIASALTAGARGIAQCNLRSNIACRVYSTTYLVPARYGSTEASPLLVRMQTLINYPDLGHHSGELI
jgi:hypothetical protein